MPSQIALNVDCMEYMKTLPDNAFDLAIVDPPYGHGNNDQSFNGSDGRFGSRFEKYRPTKNKELGAHFVGRGRSKRYQEVLNAPDTTCERTGGTWSKKYQQENSIADWDVAPSPEYFEELFRVSRNQIIWGGNYFELPPTRCFVVWRKLTISQDFSMAMAEYAWCSFNDNAKVFEYAPQSKKGDERFHPTQKPVALYEWLLELYAKDGDKILDTHLGSGSSRIACFRKNLEFVGCEINQRYFELQEERFKEHTQQQTFWSQQWTS